MQLRNVLLVTYYWPPSGGASVQRPVKWVKYLREFGINPIVLTVDPEQASYAILDHSIAEEIPEGTEVVTTRTSEPFGIYKKLSRRRHIPTSGFSNEGKPGLLQKLFRFVRGNLFIPDARVGWVKHAVKAAEQLIKEKNIGVVLTTSPPHSIHLIGMRLKERMGIKWVCDLNDPWTDIYYYKEMLHTPLAKRIDAAYERRTLETADRLITVSKDFRRLFLEKSNKITQDKFTLISNGYDQEDFVFESRPPRDAFVITYTGTIAGSYRTETFFNAVATMLRNDPAIKLKLRFVGIVSNALADHITQLGLAAITEYISPVPHRESVRYLSESTALLLAIPDVENDKGICPGKLFEYLAARKPVICIGSPDGDSAAILHECHAGETFGRSQSEQARLLAHLQELYRQWQADPDLDIREGTEQVQAYERKALTHRLAALLKEIK